MGLEGSSQFFQKFSTVLYPEPDASIQLLYTVQLNIHFNNNPQSTFRPPKQFLCLKVFYHNNLSTTLHFISRVRKVTLIQKAIKTLQCSLENQLYINNFRKCLGVVRKSILQELNLSVRISEMEYLILPELVWQGLYSLVNPTFAKIRITKFPSYQLLL